MKKDVISVEDVTISFGSATVLRNINLKVYEGEKLVIYGPSGSGKSVLLKTMAGLIKPLKGKVLIEGEDWQNLESQEKHILAQKIGMLFQKDALFDSMTAIENIEFPLKEHFKMTQQEMDHRAIDLLEAVGLADHGHKMPHELSGGMKRRLGIARALALNPRIIFYDDPISGQDPVRGDQMAQLVERIKQQFNSTVIMVLSDMNIAFEAADRMVMVVDQGLLVTGSPQDTKNHSDERVQQFINGRLQGPIHVG